MKRQLIACKWCGGKKFRSFIKSKIETPFTLDSKGIISYYTGFACSKCGQELVLPNTPIKSSKKITITLYPKSNGIKAM